MQGCRDCALYDEAGERIRNNDGAREREEISATFHTGPVLRMTITSTGRVVTYSIPKHLRRSNRPKRRGQLRRRA
jgi:hypothetical protein